MPRYKPFWTRVNVGPLKDVLAIFYSREKVAVVGALYGVNQSAVSKIRRKRSWRHLTEGLTR